MAGRVFAAAQSDGIQQLLQAEKQAGIKVSDARKRKAKRLKQAKEEALMEIQKFKEEKELDFKSREDTIMGSKTEIETQINDHTETKLSELEKHITDNKEAAIEKMLSLIYDIKGEVHKNFVSTKVKASEE